MGMKDQFQDKANELKDKAKKARSGDRDDMSQRARKDREQGQKPMREPMRDPMREPMRDPMRESMDDPMDDPLDELDEHRGA
ncbi:hypothetical protein AQJ43_04130 [Streptomyces avermitilis]|uniref:Uncharacterized protein n=2 Tax=Streptomyces avermitilis TaxID=33903 RepID=Q82H88_STRAW|nr:MULTISPECIES: hypothetical protein [Streptomyces]KUN56777.1 hypothetical protein AQJ43_04130 [Streptomyces avermitilis]MYS99213.1 hypothetical protein [Streptomyces sp. SID5469]OOV32496.1 hypothetical protein SM007_06630 [Streptomyces avermitilis]BAC71334.1 hypothetical protein SAVERM_3622 [Streptomyces avermitilis MA-4680 = NBRC 14893]BBJ51525.1 hypothetical protein SAVMC3_41540 [Streptomyces avermitilis]